MGKHGTPSRGPGKRRARQGTAQHLSPSPIPPTSLDLWPRPLDGGRRGRWGREKLRRSVFACWWRWCSWKVNAREPQFCASPGPIPKALGAGPHADLLFQLSAGLPGPPSGSAHLGAVWNPLKPPGSSGAQIFDASPKTSAPSQLLKHLLCLCQLLLGMATLKFPLPPLLSSPAPNPGTQAFIQITGQIPLPQSCECLVPICPN